MERSAISQTDEYRMNQMLQKSSSQGDWDHLRVFLQ